MRQLIAAGLLVALALTGCTEEGGDTFSVKPLSAAERANCTAEGGTPGHGGVYPYEVCFLPSPDADKACTKSTDCSGMCQADTRTCSAVTPLFGCYEYLDENGQTSSICID